MTRSCHRCAAHGPLGAAGALRPLVLVAALLARPAAAEPDYRYWTGCPALAAQPAAQACGVTADLCGRYTFVRGPASPASAERLYLVSSLSVPLRTRSLQPLVFLDLDSPIATLHLAVSGGQGELADVLALRRARLALGGSIDLPSPGVLSGAYVELLVDSEFFSLAERLGVYFPDADGTNAFAALAVASVPELNLLVLSATLTDLGRAFFRRYVDQGVSGLDALLTWRIRRAFGEDLEVATPGWFPCVKAGPHIVTVEQLRAIDPRLPYLPVDLSNVIHMVSCP